MQREDRLHYLDNLRALAMLAGVVFHAALAYSPLMHTIWPTADTGHATIVDIVAWFFHLFRMPLFFVVSGFFAALLVNNRGIAGFFRNRCARVLLPLLICLPLIITSLHWLTAEAAVNAAQPSPVLIWLRAYIQENGAMPFAPGWAHLWFLFYLMLFTVLVWVVSAFELARFSKKIATLHPAILPLAFPMLLTPALAGVTVPWPAPEFFLPSLWALVFFGAYFTLGYQLFLSTALLGQLRSCSSLWLIGGLAAYAALFWLSNGFTSQANSSQHFAHALLEAYAGFWLTLWCLINAKQWLDSSNALMRWLADASYWVYLIHLPLLFAIQYRLLDVTMHWTAKFAIALIATLALSFLSYQLLVRHTAMGKFLNGRVPKKRHGIDVPKAV